MLFDFCAECLKTFVDSQIESGVIRKDSLLPLGFTVCVVGFAWRKVAERASFVVLLSLLVSAHVHAQRLPAVLNVYSCSQTRPHRSR